MVKQTLTGPAKNISAVAFSQDGTLVAAGSEDKTIVLWDVRSQKQLGTLTGHSDTVNTLLFDPNGETLFSGSLDGTIMRWDCESLRPIDAPVTSFGASISSIFLNQDGQVKALALEKDRAIILNVNDDPPLGRRIRASEIGSSSTADVAFSPDGRLLASSGDFGDVLVWDVPSGKLSGIPLAGHQRPVSSLAYTPNGKVLVSGSIDGSVIFWDTTTHTPLGQPLTTDGFPIWSMACSPDGKTVAAGGHARLFFFDVASRKQLGLPITSQKDRIWSLDYSPDGKLLASAGNDLVVRIWKTGRQALLANTLGKADRTEDWELMPVGVSFSPDGRLLATSTRGHSVTVWNVSSGQPLLPVLYGHTGAVSSLAFRPDGNVLASGSADSDIRLWDVETHELLGTLHAQQKAVNKVVFGAGKGTLASIGEDDSIIFWDVDFEDWISRACHIANRNLTPSEWNTYLGSMPYRKTCPEL
jgi:WD40 repeat protein